MTAPRFESSTTGTPQANDVSCSYEPKVITALICNNPLLRSGLQHILSGTPFVVAEEGPATNQKVESEEPQEPALCILALSERSPHTADMVRQVKDRYSAARIVVLADHFDLVFVQEGHNAGVSGFCLTDSSREVLITFLELIMLGESVLPGTVVRSILNTMDLSPGPEPASEVLEEPKGSGPGMRSLSTRETEILNSLMEGISNKLIARKLHVTEATVKVHVKAVLRKIGVANRTQAAMWAKGNLHD